MSRDRKIDELSRIEFTGSMEEAIGRYAAQMKLIANRWDTELGLASTDVRAALLALRGSWLGLDKAARRIRARRVARRLKRAQTLASGLGVRAEKFTVQYGKQFLTLTAGAAKERARQLDEGGRL